MIELLIVIAIIALLASLLIPTLSRAKASASSARCKSNLRQIGLGLQMYVDDEGHYPRTPPGQPYAAWHWAVNSILNQPLESVPRAIGPVERYQYPVGCFVCPSDKRKVFAFGGSYGYNAWGVNMFGEGLGLGGQGFTWTTAVAFPAVTRPASVRVPSEMIAVGDGYIGSFGSETSRQYELWSSLGELMREGVRDFPPGFREKRFLDLQPTGRKRHQGRLNMVFCDGHVEAPKARDLFFSIDARHLRLWHVDNEPHGERLRYTK